MSTLILNVLNILSIECLALVNVVSRYEEHTSYIGDVTRWREDMTYVRFAVTISRTSECSERVTYCFASSKKNLNV